MVGTHIDLLGYTVSIQSEINYQLSYLLVFSRITWCCVRRTFVKISECDCFFISVRSCFLETFSFVWVRPELVLFDLPFQYKWSAGLSLTRRGLPPARRPLCWLSALERSCSAYAIITPCSTYRWGLQGLLYNNVGSASCTPESQWRTPHPLYLRPLKRIL